MLQETNSIVALIIVTTLLALILFSFIVTLLFIYQKKQMAYSKSIEKLNVDFENNLMKTKLEIQEQTFQNISREIHDNIGLSLTLAKLNLNTIQYIDWEKEKEKIKSSVELIGKALTDLSDISKSLNPEIIYNNGLLKALETEIQRINKTGAYKVNFEIKGEPVFLNSFKELVIYRIIQEALNNTIKHSKANNINIILDYTSNFLLLFVIDDGIGFSTEDFSNSNNYNGRSGLNNIQQRSKIISGDCLIESKRNAGTSIKVTVPIK